MKRLLAPALVLALAGPAYAQKQAQEIDVQRGPASDKHHQRLARCRGPLRLHGLGQQPRAAETPAAGAVDPDEIGVAETADGPGPVAMT